MSQLVTTADRSGDRPGLRHQALFYDRVEELVEVGVPYLAEGLSGGEAVVLACRPQVADRLLTALDAQPRQPTVIDPEQVYGHVASALASWEQLVRLRVADGAPAVRLLGEVDYGDDPAAWAAWGRFEAVCNESLRAYPLTSVCAYAAPVLPDPVRTMVERTHPLLLTRDGPVDNERFVEPRDYLRGLAVPAAADLPGRPPALRTTVQHPADLAALRARVCAELQGRAVPEDVQDDLVTAVSEVAGNGLVHGLPPVLIRLWAAPGELVCAVTDRGRGTDDPLVGYAGDVDLWRAGQRGLWLARRLCDSVSMAATAEGFTVVLRTAARR